MKARNRILLVLSLVFAVVLGACATGSTTETPATRTPRPATATPESTPEPVDTITDATAEATTVAEATGEATAETANIVETAVAGSDFTVLVQAIEAAGLVDALSANGPFTVFAPTDAAFTALLETLGMTAEELLGNTELLTSVLQYHVVAGALQAADLTNGQTLTTLSGLTLTVTVDGSTVMINDATVVQADIATSNGVIHVIDKVLVPAPAVEATAEATTEATEVAAVVEATEAAVVEATTEATEAAVVEATTEATEVAAVVEATEVPATTTVISNVCLVADQGGIKDGNFNALANVGMQRAEQDFGLQTQIIESDEPADYEPNMETCIRNGANVIVSVGFTQTDAARNIAIAHPEVFIIGVDQFYGEGQPANVVSLLFREDQAGFLVGVMAALVTKSNIIGGVYGRDVPAVVKFRHGFEEGARYINPEIVVLGQYTDRFDNPTLGATIAEQFIGEGADVIFGAGGGTGTGGIQYAAEQGVYVIGVDQDEYLTNFGAGDSPGAEFVISSALKSVDVGVYDMLAALSGDTTKTFLGGGTYMLEAANDGIGFADRHDSDLSDEVVTRVQEVFDLLKAGELETNVDPVTGAFLVPPADMTPEAMMTSEPEVEATPVAEVTETAAVVEATEVAAVVEATEAPVVEVTEAVAVVEATEVAVEATEVPATTTVISNVCLVADQGGIKDGNFNALANVGMQRAEQDFGLQTQIIESDEPADYEPNMETCIRNGANVIVSVGFTQTDAARNIAIAHPEVFIIGVDQFYGEGQPANVVSLLFREDQAGFLVGVMAALVTQSNIIGGVYGRDVPAVVKFRHGFEEGARYINPEIVVLGQYTDRFDNPTLGATIAEQFIGEGADVIFGAGGGTGTGGIQYAAEQGVYVIGVDQDEYLTNFGAGDSPGAELVISSALKSVDVGVYDMLAALSGDTTKTFLGGGTYMLEAANDGIGFADKHDSDLSDEVVARVQEVFELLKAGELETNVDPVTGAFLVPPADMTPEAMMTSEPEVEVTPEMTAEATPSN